MENSKEYDYDRQQEPAIFSKALSDLILTQQNPAELVALYWFYYYTAKWQQTNQPKATNGYAAKGLHWSSARVGKIAKQLEILGLIKRHIHWNKETKKISGHYIQVNFVWTKQCLRKAMLKESNILAFHRTNALSDNNLNALSNNNKKGNFFVDDKTSSKKEVFDPTDLPIKLANNPAIQKAWNEFVQHRNENKRKLTPLACKKLIKKLLPFNEQEIVEAINRSIENSWTGIFFSSTSMTYTGKPGKVTYNKPFLSKEAKDIANLCTNLNIEAGSVQMENYYLQLKRYWNTLQEKNEKIVTHLGWSLFHRRWIEYLERKQDSFPTRGFYDLEIGRARWNEFIRECEIWTGYNFTTGRRRD
jgi:hypothetical protein